MSGSDTLDESNKISQFVYYYDNLRRCLFENVELGSIFCEIIPPTCEVRVRKAHRMQYVDKLVEDVPHREYDVSSKRDIHRTTQRVVSIKTSPLPRVSAIFYPRRLSL